MSVFIDVEILVFCDLVKIPLFYLWIIQPVLYSFIGCHLFSHLRLNFFTDGINIVISAQIFQRQFFSGLFINGIMLVLFITTACSLIEDQFQGEKIVGVQLHVAVNVDVLITFFIFHALFELFDQLIGLFVDIKINGICGYFCLLNGVTVCILIRSSYFYLRHFYIRTVALLIHLILADSHHFEQITK